MMMQNMATRHHNEEFVLRVDFHCTSDPKLSLGCKSLSFSSPPITVGDIARQIEETFEIPTIATRLQYNSVVLHENDQVLDMNLRNGDTFTAQYYSAADCKEVSECIEWLENLLDLLERWNAGSLSVNVHNIEDKWRLDDLCFNHFSPWMTPIKDTNKFYFISKNGLKLATKIIDILLEHPPSSLPPTLLHIESMTLGIFWNISVDEHILRAIVRTGGLDTCVKALLREPVESIKHNAFVKEIIRRALGALANLCELEEIRLTIASNKEAIKQMLSISLSPAFQQHIVHRVIMIFLDLSYTHETHKHLILNDGFGSFIRMDLPYYDGTSLLMRYHHAVLFAILLLNSPQYFSTEDTEYISSSLDNFTRDVQYTLLSEIEEGRGVHWGTLSPLVIALYQNKHHTLYQVPCKLTVLLSLMSLLIREYHRKVLVKEGMVDFCVCLPWHCKGRVKDNAVELVSVIQQADDIAYEPPSLLNACKAAVAVVYECGLYEVVHSTVPELAGKLWTKHHQIMAANEPV